MSGGIAISDGVSSSGNFDIGSAIINQLTLLIDNTDEKYSNYDFTDAIITVYGGIELDSRTELLRKGVFNASDPTNTPSIITLKALDNMSKMDKTYDGGISFPATLKAIVQYCCAKCGVMLEGSFTNDKYIVKSFPEDIASMTYRTLISYCAQIAGCYARCNTDGNLELNWYDTNIKGIIDAGL